MYFSFTTEEVCPKIKVILQFNIDTCPLEEMQKVEKEGAQKFLTET